MKKIAILSAVNIKHMSLVSLYTSFLKEHHIPYDIIYMDKYGEEESIGAENTFRYVNLIDHSWSRRKKILHYFKFVGYAKKVLEKEQYDFIIVWNDVAITMLGLYLARKWKGKYCLNIRDYNGENKWYVYKIFERAIKGSAFTTISSEGFKSFLPEHDYVSLYSYNASLLKDAAPRAEKREAGKPVRISFIGNVRFFEINKKLVELFRNDERFELYYHGTNAEEIEKYAHEIKAENVFCSGAFPVAQTNRFLEEADIINNAFGDKTPGARTLTSIRLFHAAYMRMPILVNSGTYMDEISGRFGIGYAIQKLDETLPDDLFRWYTSLDFDHLAEGCNALLNEAEAANASFERKLKDWLL